MGTTPNHHRRFGSFDVLAQASRWDPVTRQTVEDRMPPRPAPQFFTPSEWETAQALLDRLLAQDREPRIDLVGLVDQRLAAGETDGWRYADMPEDGAGWRATLSFLDADAQTQAGQSFAERARPEQKRQLETIRTSERWHDLPGAAVWNLWMRYACAAFYSHPWAWNEIGFPGPAYPRGYANLGLDRREHWEQPSSDPRNPVPWAERVEAAWGRHHENSRGDQVDRAGDAEVGDGGQATGGGVP